MSEETPRRDKRRWRWSIPPVPEWRRAELQILRDVEDPLATTLWRAVRDVRLWLETPPGRRAGVVQPPNERVRERLAYAVRQAPELGGALGQFARLLSAPADVQAHGLAAACAVVAEWAEERALAETAVQFAEAAAALDEESPRLANLAARVCKRAALHHHAETWYDRGIGLARRAGDDEQYIKARLGLGELLTDLGHHKRARSHLLKAARRAAEKGLRSVAGETQHHLLHAYGESCPLRKALDYAEAALHQYPVHHPRVPALAHDTAYVLLKHARYLEAHSLAQQAVALLPISIQALPWSTVAWAAAGAGFRDEYESARIQGESLVAIFPAYAPGTLRNLARAAAVLEEWGEVERFAAHALEAARARSDTQIIADSIDLLDLAASRSLIVPSRMETPDWRIASLVLTLSQRLRTWKPR